MFLENRICVHLSMFLLFMMFDVQFLWANETVNFEQCVVDIKTTEGNIKDRKKKLLFNMFSESFKRKEFIQNLDNKYKDTDDIYRERQGWGCKVIKVKKSDKAQSETVQCDLLFETSKEYKDFVFSVKSLIPFAEKLENANAGKLNMVFEKSKKLYKEMSNIKDGKWKYSALGDLIDNLTKEPKKNIEKGLSIFNFDIANINEPILADKYITAISDKTPTLRSKCCEDTHWGSKTLTRKKVHVRVLSATYSKGDSCSATEFAKRKCEIIVHPVKSCIKVNSEGVLSHHIGTDCNSGSRLVTQEIFTAVERSPKEQVCVYRVNSREICNSADNQQGELTVNYRCTNKLDAVINSKSKKDGQFMHLDCLAPKHVFPVCNR